MTTQSLCKSAPLLSEFLSLQTACCVKNGSTTDPDQLEACYLARSGMAPRASYDAIETYKTTFQEAALERCSTKSYVENNPSECCHTYDGQTLGQIGQNDASVGKLCPTARI